MSLDTAWPPMPGALVVARFARVHGDGSDADDRPDWIAPVGAELTFTTTITGPLVYDPTGAKIIVDVGSFRAVVDDAGFAVAKDGGHPIRLAPTDDPLMSRTGWLWTCSWTGGKVSFPAPSEGAVNLADFIIAPPGDPVAEEWIGRIPELIDAAGNLVSIESVTSDAGDILVTLTDGGSHRFPMPPGVPGHSPVVGLDGDRLTVDGVPVGDSLRGPAGHTPDVVVDGDVITIDGQSTDPLTGPPVATRWEGTALVVDDQPPVDLKGAEGDPGPVSSLTIGTVTTGTASASITGTAPDQKLNLVLPPGTPGAPGAPGAVATSSTYLIVGPGRPDSPATTGGTITGSEPVGTEYRSTDGASVGAWVWMKRPTGWVVIDGDTGWRNVAAGLLNGWTATMNGRSWAIRRLGSTVSIAANLTVPTADVLQSIYAVPAGFHLSGVEPFTGGAIAPLAYDGQVQGAAYLDRPDILRARSTGTGMHRRFGMTWLTADAWPTALPGSPA